MLLLLLLVVQLHVIVLPNSSTPFRLLARLLMLLLQLPPLLPDCALLSDRHPSPAWPAVERASGP